jgi:quercetin dioxygenase-like cupin family protein
MSHISITDPAALLVDPNSVRRFDVLGPMVEYFTPPGNGEPCVMRGTIPPGVSVPLHAHADPETFLMISGEIEGLRHTADGFDWITIRPGDIFHVPGHAKHAFRNRKNIPAVMMIVSTDKIGPFLPGGRISCRPGIAAGAGDGRGDPAFPGDLGTLWLLERHA